MGRLRRWRVRCHDIFEMFALGPRRKNQKKRDEPTPEETGSDHASAPATVRWIAARLADDVEKLPRPVGSRYLECSGETKTTTQSLKASASYARMSLRLYATYTVFSRWPATMRHFVTPKRKSRLMKIKQPTETTHASQECCLFRSTARPVYFREYANVEMSVRFTFSL